MRDAVKRLLGKEVVKQAMAARTPFAGELMAIRPGASLAPRLSALGYYDEAVGEPRKPYRMVGDGLAEVCITGVLSRDPSFLRAVGFSDQQTTTEMAAAIHAAIKSEDVRGLMLYLDSPGGTTRGLSELIAAAQAAVASGKPVHAYAEDAASGAYWIAAQANRLSMSLLSEVGSIGVIYWIEDASELAADMGLKVHLVRTGPLKAAGGEPLAGVSEEELAYFQKRANETLDFFLAAVANGRGMSIDAVRELASGACYGSAEAVANGLADAASTYGEAIVALAAAVAATAAAADTTADEPPSGEPDIDSEDVAPIQAQQENTMKTEPNAEATASRADEERGSAVLRKIGQAFAGVFNPKQTEPPQEPEPAPPEPKPDIAALVAAEVRKVNAENVVAADLKALDGKATPAAIAAIRPALLSAKRDGRDEDYAGMLKALGSADVAAILGGPVADAKTTSDAHAGLGVNAHELALLEQMGMTTADIARVEAKFLRN